MSHTLRTVNYHVKITN